MFLPFILAATTFAQQFSRLPLPLALVDAVANSPEVRQSSERIRENLALLRAARATASPQGTFGYVQGPQGGPNNTTITQRLATIGASALLGDYWAYSPAVRQAEANVRQAQYDFFEAQRVERGKVVTLYYGALRAIATARIRSQALARAREDENAARIRFRAGDAPRLDVVRAQVALAQAQADFTQSRVDVANSAEALAIETGAPASALAVVQAAHGATVPIPATPQQAVDLALEHRADVASAQQAVRAESAAVTVAERGTLPAVTVSAGYTSGVDSGVRVHGPSANVQIGLPFSHVSRYRAEAERARLEQARAKGEAVVRQVRIEVAAAARTYAASEAATGAATRARVAAQAQLRATEVGYRSGASSSLEVADARRTYAQAALMEINAIYARAQARASLEAAIGL